MSDEASRPFVCAAECNKSHGVVDLLFGERGRWDGARTQHSTPPLLSHTAGAGAEPVPTITPLACGHSVCIECVSTRPSLLTRCAKCGFTPGAPKKKKKPKPQPKPQPADAGWSEWEEGGDAAAGAAAVEEEVAGVHTAIDVDEIACQVCGSQDDEKLMVLCDDCPHGYHTFCLVPKLPAIPSGDWFCPRCTRQREDKRKRAIERSAEHWQHKRRAPPPAAAAPAVSFAPSVNGGGAPEGESESDSPLPKPSPVSDASSVGAGRGFEEYCKRAQPGLERREPGLSRSGVLGRLGAEWRAMSDAERRKYGALAVKEEERERTAAVAQEVSALAARRPEDAGEGPSGARIVPVFARATRGVSGGAEEWLSLSATDDGRLAAEWRIGRAATGVFLTLGWAQGRPAAVVRTDASSVKAREGIIYFNEAHIARFAGTTTQQPEDPGGKRARPVLIRMWLDHHFGDHTVATEPFLLRYVQGSAGPVTVDKPTADDWVTGEGA